MVYLEDFDREAVLGLTDVDVGRRADYGSVGVEMIARPRLVRLAERSRNYTHTMTQ